MKCLCQRGRVKHHGSIYDLIKHCFNHVFRLVFISLVKIMTKNFRLQPFFPRQKMRRAKYPSLPLVRIQCACLSLVGSLCVYRHDTKKISVSARDHRLNRKKGADTWTYFTLSPSENKTQCTVISEEMPCGYKLHWKNTTTLKDTEGYVDFVN